MPDELIVNGVLYLRADGRSEDWLTVAQAAQLSGRATRTLYDAIRSGALDARTPNGLTKGLRIKRSELMAWMEGRCAGD